MTARGLTQFTNPLEVLIGDPFVLQDGRTYYMYGTRNPGAGYEVFTSTDLVRWRWRGYCYRKSRSTYGRRDFWAPEVIRKGRKYYMFLITRRPPSHLRNIVVATSDSPLGPFTDATGPIFPTDRGVIDPHAFRDPATGKYYLYVTEDTTGPPAKMLVAELAPSLLEMRTTPTLCMSPDQPWEHDWIEGTFIIPHKGLYYMMYSGFAWWEPHYSIGYAVAPNPTGPWKKFDGNPIIGKTDRVGGPGHNSVVKSPDGKDWIAVYHRHTLATPRVRSLAIDRLSFDRSTSGPDLLTAKGVPSHEPVPLPSGARPLRTATTDLFGSANLDHNKWLIFNESSANWKLDGGDLAIWTQDGDVWQDRFDAGNIFLQFAPRGDFSIRTQVKLASAANHEQAFLTVWQDPDNYVRIASVYDDGPVFEIGSETDAKYERSSFPNSLGSEVHLRIDRNRQGYRFHVSADGKQWEELGEPLQRDFALPKVGIGACSPVSGKRRLARFRHFIVK